MTTRHGLSFSFSPTNLPHKSTFSAEPTQKERALISTTKQIISEALTLYLHKFMLVFSFSPPWMHPIIHSTDSVNTSLHAFRVLHQINFFSTLWINCMQFGFLVSSPKYLVRLPFHVLSYRLMLACGAHKVRSFCLIYIVHSVSFSFTFL